MTTTPETPAAGGAAVAPPGARFDPATGAELSAGAGAGGERRQSYALQPGEPVASFNLVTSLMPLASGSAPQTYRWALGVGILIPVVAGALGFLAFAFVAAAVVVPAIYVVYMYDVNQWEDQPIGVVLGAIGAAAALGVGFTFLWHAGILDSNISSVNFDGNGAERGALVEPAGPGAAGPDRRRGAQGGRAAGAGEPAAVRRHDRRAHLRCRRGCRLRGGRDHRGQPRAVQQLRPDRLAERRLLGLARSSRPRWSSRSCTARPPASPWPATPASAPATTASSRPTSAAWRRR